MKRHLWKILVAAVLVAAAIAAFFHWRRTPEDAESLFALVPGNTNSAVYADFDALRQSPFLAQFYIWLPQTKESSDYTQFVNATGFNYERDLHRILLCTQPNRASQSNSANPGESGSELFAVADGNFDRKKIAAYALGSGIHVTLNGHEVFRVPVENGAKQISFTFLSEHRIALTDSPDPTRLVESDSESTDSAAWRERILRVSGSPIFFVTRKGGEATGAIANASPGGLQSPQLAALVDQLQWISIAGKPEGNVLRVVADGEATSDGIARQLADLLNGIVTLAQTGLNDPKLRQQMPPQTREAYLELLKSAAVDRVDRGDAKSVRLAFTVTPQFLDAARNASLAPAPEAPQPPPAKNKKRIGGKK